jgi:hypothetical protein
LPTATRDQILRQWRWKFGLLEIGCDFSFVARHLHADSSAAPFNSVVLADEAVDADFAIV